jgi:peptidoglycan-associated lipoprotein
VQSSATGPSTGAAEKTETVEPIAEFPITSYEIEEQDSMASESETDAEIERLREDLAATESELDQIRAEEEKRDYSSSDAATSSESSGDMAGSQESATSGAQAPETQTESAVSQAPMEPSERDVIDLPGMPAENSIFFGFDQAAVDSEYEAILIEHANFLKSHPELKIEVQGNCDERGSREYNIALGQRRAFTVKRALELLGVDGNRIETVSFGSEKPMAFGHDEESWRLNRRADIVYVN